MAKVKSPHEKVGNTSTKKKKKNKNKYNVQASQKNYCDLCRKSYSKKDIQVHMHGMQHHRELQTVLGKDSCHECQACKESSMGLNEYAQHITTDQHKAKLNSLVSRNIKPPSLNETLGKKIMNQVRERNKTLKLRARREMKKKKKKQKQMAGQKRVEMLQQAAERNGVVSTVVTLENSKQVNQRLQEQMQDIYKEGTKNAVVQNKENNVSCRGPAGQTWHNPYVWDKSTHQLKSDNFSGSSNFSKVKFDVSRINRYFRKPHNAQRSAVNVPDQTAWRAISRHDCYRKQHGVTDFTSDALPQNGAIVFDHSPNENTASSQPVQESSYSLEPPASANSSANAAPMQDIDVSAMLRHIRRELGVREPCRADREARRQNSEVGVRSADQAGVKRAEEAGCSFRNYRKEAGLHITVAAAPSVQSSAVSLLAPASSSCVRPSNIVSTQPKQVKKIQRTSQHCEKSSVVASDTNGPSNGKERESQGGLDSFRKTPPSEPNVNFIRKVRIAHKPGKGQEGKEVGLKPALNKMLSTAVARSRLSCREMYGDVTGKKQVRAKGTPRFGIELAKPPSDQDHSAQEEDLPLSEGFHWESLPHSPPDAQRNGLPPQPWGATYKESHMETHSDSQKQESSEPPGAAQEACGDRMVKAISVKVEPSVADGNRDLKDGSGARKRKHKVDTHGDTSDKDPKGKRMKTKSNKDQDQMDQLLAVSLREEELSQSLQDLDKSLIQARNTLQVAYAEVQRLLLWRQQCMTEVNSLRAQRIEILQGIQGGHSGEHRAERATTSSAGVAAVMQSRLSPLSSSDVLPSTSNQKLPDSQPVPSTSQPLALSTVPLKQEICEAPILLCNPETPQVPVNLPVHLLPSDLFQPLLLTSCSAATTTSVDSLKQLETACSTTVNVSPESSAQQQEQISWEGLKDCGKAVRLIREDADSESEGENIQPAAEKPISTAADNSGGSKSDDSVKMVEPSNLIVIDLDESDIEEIVSNVPNQEPPQKSVSVELKTANTQTCQQNDDDRKPILVPAMDAVSPQDCADVVEDDEPSLGAFENHQGPVLGLQIHKGLLYTCSGDNTARAYSLMSRECQAVFKGHTNKVNCLLVSPPSNMPERLFTGSSDQTIRCYSIKSQKCLEQISLSDRVLCLHIAWNILFAGLASGSVVSHDLKTLKQLDVFECHGPRGVSCLGTTQEGARRVLLVGSYDSTISVRDAKNGLLLRSLEGHTKTVLCMKVVNDLVFSGSSDKSVHAHNIHTGELLRIYKGHGHAVTSMVILGKVMVTACLDKLVRVYELQSHDRLQVYGGHSDMVMCMTVHKSVMYTGCYDGSIQAVKLNLMENYRCWWQNCSLIFGMGEHLVQHLIKDHTNRNLMTAKCRWRGCSAFFAKQESVREELPEHMQTHVENDSKVQP